MKRPQRHRDTGMVAAQMLALWLLCVVSVCAQQLPIRRYDVADGLAHGTVASIYQDAKGYLWFGTWEGLSRFDGYRFTNYDMRDGLNHPSINHVTEDRQGRLWVATNGGGVARLIDAPQGTSSRSHNDQTPVARAKFVSFTVGDTQHSNQVNEMLFDSQNNLWCLTDYGLYRARVAENQSLKFETIVLQNSGDSNAMLEDGRGRFWFGIGNELVEVRGGQVIKHGAVGSSGRQDLITGIIENRQGGLLIAGWYELFEFTPPTEDGGRGQWQRLPLKLKANQWINVMYEDSAGTLWLGTSIGLIKYQDVELSDYTTAQGLSINYIRALFEDRDGNLWIGTEGGGVCKLNGQMIVSYTKTEGFADLAVAGIVEDNEGRIKARLFDSSVIEVAAGKVSRSRKIDDPPVSSDSFMISRNKQGLWWWKPNLNLVVRFQKPVLRLLSGREISITDVIPAAALPTSVLFYEDETGKLWFSKDDGRIYRTDARRPGPLVFESFLADFPLATRPRSLMISDRAGGLWLGNGEALGRLWKGNFVPLQPMDGLPEMNPRSFFIDSRGWLWIGMRYTGVSMTKEPGIERPQFINYRVEQNQLSSNAVWTITEDDFGRLYFGTDRGLDQFDPRVNRWRHYTSRDGLASDKIHQLYKDRQGNIWIATLKGLSKFDPRAERTINRPAPIYLSRVQVAGEDLPLPETGASHIPRLELTASRNNLSIEYVALQFQGEDNLHYQYQLEGVDRDWSAPTKMRSVNYARLAPGTYRFLVRAINTEGMASEIPAAFQFHILRPVYQRWWFLSLAALMIGLLAYTIYRYRVARILEMANMRTRIATDLHDDIGANLTKIAILSEVARQQFGNGNAEKDNPLSSIARISRESVSAMSDIVWAINPRRDHLLDLVRRMRQHAEEVFTRRDIELRFDASDAMQNLKLGVDVRRDLFLIFKEAVNNAARHSGCSQVEIDFRADDGWLSLRIDDDGVGFDPSIESDGQGLMSMRRRAQTLGGMFDVESRAGQGTTVRIKIPYDRSLHRL